LWSRPDREIKTGACRWQSTEIGCPHPIYGVVPVPFGLSVRFRTSLVLTPMRDMVLFPHIISRIFVAREKTRQAVERALVADRRVLVVAQRHGSDDRPSTMEALYPVGVL
jgi:hypothetical protein